MPLLQRDWNPNLPAVLARTAEWARDEEGYWEQAVSEVAVGVLQEQRGGVELSVTVLAALPTALVRRIHRRAIKTARGSLKGIGWNHIEQLRSLAQKDGGAGEIHLPGIVAVRSFGKIRIERASNRGPRPEFDIAVEPPATVPLPGGKTKLIFQLSDRAGKDRGYNDLRAETLDWERVPRLLRLRGWRPGDSYRPQGRSSAKKLKALFQESRTPIWERAGWPVLAVPAQAGEDAGCPDRIVWTRRFGVAEDFRPRVESRRWLSITEIDTDASEDSVNRMGGQSVNT